MLQRKKSRDSDCTGARPSQCGAALWRLCDTAALAGVGMGGVQGHKKKPTGWWAAGLGAGGRGCQPCR